MLLTTNNRTFVTQNKSLQTLWKPNGMLVWLDSSLKFIELDSFGNVSTWFDKSGNKSNFIQTNGNNRPSYNIKTINGNNSLHFNNKLLNSFTNINLNLYTIFTVFRSSITGYLYYYSDNANTETGFYLSTGVDTLFTSVNNLSNSTFKTYNSWATDNTWRICCHTYNGTHNTHNLYVNDSIAPLTTYLGNNSNPGNLNSNKKLNIGSRSNLIGGMTGELVELIMYDKYLSTEEISQINTYLNNKYKIY